MDEGVLAVPQGCARRHLSGGAPTVLLDDPEDSVDIEFVDRDDVGRMPIGMLIPRAR